MESINAAADAFLRQLEVDVTHALENLQRAQDRQKKHADRRWRDLELQVEDEVLLSTRNLPLQGAAGGSSKLGPLYCGPFKILEKYTAAYKLDLPPHINIHPVFHVAQLKLYRRPEDAERTYTKPEPIITASGEPEYEVEEISNHRK